MASAPISTLYAPAFVIYNVLLNFRAAGNRAKTGILLGGNSPSPITSAAEEEKKNSQSAGGNPIYRISPRNPLLDRFGVMERAIRAHANFIENVPLALFSIYLYEINGAPTSHIHGLLGTLLAARILHAEFGLMLKQNSLGFGRIFGYFGTIGVYLASAIGLILQNWAKMHNKTKL
ncbi:uncharacterized protein VTP21DRAFT_1212 [Calcarisporiella thermophila]|uniref:uncharacterized protein n=1 Tax=Calcarisporiella thermophila TaxID=911321 RepID=UPI0037429391